MEWQTNLQRMWGQCITRSLCEFKIAQTLWGKKNFVFFFSNQALHLSLPYHPEISLWNMYLRDVSARVHKNIHDSFIYSSSKIKTT